jgi:alpha-N-arabinofuranosidase
MKHLFVILLSMVFVFTNCDWEPEIKITIQDQVTANVDDRIFGQFLEKPSWHGEIGPEAALKPGTHELQEGVLKILNDMNIPVMRFPGGTDVDITDWTEMIDNVPGRDGDRPLFIGIRGDTVSQHFGYDEALRLAENVGSEMILVVNFGNAYFKRMPIEEAAMHEAGLIAYCNAEAGAELPEGMSDWPSVRAENGHPEPYNVRYVQIANEPWVMAKELKRRGPVDPEAKEHYFECMDAYIKAFKAIDPDIEIIVDGNCQELTEPLYERFGDRIDYVAHHNYKPWGITKIFRGETQLPRDSITDEQVWKAWVAVPSFNDAGQSVIDGFFFNLAKNSGYPVAVTEWNWNGWWGMDSVDPEKLGSRFTKGVGATGYLHALMRNADVVDIGIQSMLIGNSWGITGVRVSPEADVEPHMYPTGQVTSFYSKKHGNELLTTTSENVPVYEQPFKMSGIEPEDSVSYLDVVATRDTENIFLHVINRHFDRDLQVAVDVNAMGNLETEATHHVFWGNLSNEPCKEGSLEVGCFEEKSLVVKNNQTNILFPKRSVSIVEFKRK